MRAKSLALSLAHCGREGRGGLACSPSTVSGPDRPGLQHDSSL